MGKRLFGTDGIRAVAGEAPLDPPGVRKFGAALAEVLRHPDGGPVRVALGRDTRESGPWLRDAVSCGLVSRGASAVDTGVITTPGLAYVVKHNRFDAGVMISASHNPFHDNGLKVFGPDGTKLPDDVEREIETLVLDSGLTDPGESGQRSEADGALLRDYVAHLESVIPAGDRFKGLKLTLDCANGSAAGFGGELFRHFGAEVETLGDAPDGRNINLDCGSLHLDRLADTVVRGERDAGLAFDGDADRCLVVDRKGRVVDGDYILYVAGRRLKRDGKLRGDALVATIMSNYWLEERLGQEGIRTLRAPVGDKYVLEQMIDQDLVLGGEQSGHVIFRDLASTGDGLLTGLLFVDSVIEDGQRLHEIVDGIEPYPQLLINITVREKPDLATHPTVGPVVREVEAALAGSGRLVLRYSGTEPLARVMIEGKDQQAVRQHAERLAAVIERELGA
jgi:phosphoglucosamine mutase